MEYNSNICVASQLHNIAIYGAIYFYRRKHMSYLVQLILLYIIGMLPKYPSSNLELEMEYNPYICDIFPLHNTGIMVQFTSVDTNTWFISYNLCYYTSLHVLEYFQNILHPIWSLKWNIIPIVVSFPLHNTIIYGTTILYFYWHKSMIYLIQLLLVYILTCIGIFPRHLTSNLELRMKYKFHIWFYSKEASITNIHR